MESVTSVVWGHSALELVVDVSPDGPVGDGLFRAALGTGNCSTPHCSGMIGMGQPLSSWSSSTDRGEKQPWSRPLPWKNDMSNMNLKIMLL